MEKTPLSPADLANLRWVLDPAISPDGMQGVYVLRDVHPDDPEERYRYQLMHLTSLDGMSEGETGHPLTSGLDAVIRNPAWSADGQRVAFLANASGTNQVWMYDIASKALAQVTAHSHAVSEFSLSADGTKIAYIAKTPDTSNKFGEIVEGRYTVIRRVPYKFDGMGYWDCTWSQVYVAALRSDLTTVKSGEIAAPDPVQVTHEPFHDVSVQWSSDSTKLAFVSTGGVDPEKTPWRHIFVTSVESDGNSLSFRTPEQLTDGVAVNSIAWSPAGDYFAMVADDNCEDRATNTGIWIARVSDGKFVNLTGDIDRPVGDLVTDDMNADSLAPRPDWSDDGKHIVCLMSDKGQTWIVRIGFDPDEAFEKGFTESHVDPVHEDPWTQTRFDVQPIDPGEYRIFSYSFDGKGRALAARSAAFCPGDIFSQDVLQDPSSPATQLTDVNKEFVATRLISDPEPFSFTGSEGRLIEGWMLLPTNGAEAPYPLVLHVHGGPHSAYSMVFNYELQQLAADGYAVLYVNPHGSQTYGRAINIGSRCDLGGKDYNDLMLAVDEAVKRPDIDEDRLGVAGGSYGGYMTNYIITQTDRFKAACAQRSSTDRVSRYFMGSEGFRHARWEAPGFPWDHLDYFINNSTPILAPQVNTPLMLIHSQGDTICPVQLAEEQFVALNMLEKPVELVVFFGETHNLPRIGRPANRVERLRRISNWFKDYV